MRRRQFLSLLAPITMLACTEDVVPPTEITSEEALEATEPPQVGAPSQDDRKRQAATNNAFAFEIYEHIDRPGENVAVSPVSISTALTMAWAGAKGETEAQMRKVLHLEGTRDEVLARTAKTLGALQTSKDYELAIANRLFGEKSSAFEGGFLDESKKHFGAPLAPVDFKNDADGSRKQINAWVEKQTKQRIKNILPEGSLDNLTRLVLVNAVHFVAAWQTPFSQERTEKQAFHTSSSADPIDVSMMFGRIDARLAEKDGMKLLSLPYAGGTMSMVIVLPNDADALEKGSPMTLASFEALRSAATDGEVDVVLPRFEIDPASPVALVDVLAKLGMPLAFDADKSDFTGISNPSNPDERLSIAKVFHKAFVKVDEKGTEAAAATAVAMSGKGAAPTDVPSFRADRPFMFFIVDELSGLVLFRGTVRDPSKK
ncbi:MAG: serpin family protein [Polyangiaceae bacterium]|nr:serpin family protein [Polyangiaceae bacterium]